MELRHLRYFIAVAEESHFGRAAERLHIAQPPLSQQIKNLEDELGVELFKRTIRPIELTDAGVSFYSRARVILDAAGDAAIEVQRIGRGEQGHIVVGFMSAAMLARFPLVLRSFRNDRPDVEIRFVQMTSEEQIEAVAAGHLDTGFVAIEDQRTSMSVGNIELAVETIWREELFAALPLEHELAQMSEIPLRALADELFISLPRRPQTGYYDQLTALCGQAGFRPRIGQEVSQLPIALTLIAAGYGVALMPQCVVQAWRDLVKFVPLARDSSIGVTMIHRPDNRSPVLAALQESFRNELGEPGGAIDPPRVT